MLYRVIGLMSGSSLDGLDIVFTELLETAGSWSCEIIKSECIEYDNDWINKLKNAVNFSALDYALLHIEYGHYLGKIVNDFIERNNLHHQVNLIASHGHTTFHLPEKLLTAQIGDGASIAAETQLPVVTDLRAMDVAFCGQGAPIVPIGEKLLFKEYTCFLNLGGIANISVRMNNASEENKFIAFDICAANQVLNMLANFSGLQYDKDGNIAAAGNVSIDLLKKLNELDYYRRSYPKSLANSFAIETVFPIIKDANISIEDAMRTYVQHIVLQVKNALDQLQNYNVNITENKMLVTGGGALNIFLIKQLKEVLQESRIEIIIPDKQIIENKEALIMALIGTLRWREEYNVLSSVTGAKRNSIGGALWLGTEA